MLANNPSVYQLHFGLGNTYYKKGEYSKAEECYRKSLEFNPRIGRTYQNIAAIYCYHLYDNDQAAEWTGFCLKLHKKNEYSLLMR